MTDQPFYFRFLEAAKQAETAEQLEEDGFVVQNDRQVGEARFDLVAEKGSRTLAYEFKAGRSSKTGKEHLLHLQQTAAERGWEFRIVVVNPPPRVRIEIDTLQQSLLQYLLAELPDNLDQLSTHTRVTGLNDVEVSDLRVHGDEMKISGNASIDVELEYGSGSDQESGKGATLRDSYPLDFRATFALDGDLISVQALEVDTSSFYE